jgi:hypothetical protein
MRLQWTGAVRAIVLCALAAGLAAGGIAYASIPDSSGVIHACFKKASPNQGQLRVIDTERGQVCSSNENTVEWSAVGPQGPPGISGYEVVANSSVQEADGRSLYQPSVACPSGKSVLGGGGQGFLPLEGGGSLTLQLAQSFPSGDGTVWNVGFEQPSGFPIDSGELHFTVFATCALVSD